MDTQQMIDLCKQHTLFSWAARDAVMPMPIERAEGVYLYQPDGRRILDFNSQLMSVKIGHSHPKVVAAMKAAADGLIYAFPHSATKVRARLSRRLAELVPGDINTFYFTLGGAEANENAIKMARMYTGRHKILSRYQYHGATICACSSQEIRDVGPMSPALPGWCGSWTLDPTIAVLVPPEEQTANNLQYLEEVITYEGPQNIAAMIVKRSPAPMAYCRRQAS